MFKIALTLLVFSVSTSAFAAKKQDCKFELACDVNGRKFSLEFKSPANDCTEDDMILNFKMDGATEKMNLPPQWFFFTEHISKTQNSICKDSKDGSPFAAYLTEEKYVLLFTKVSGRPGLDRIYGIVINPVTRKVLDSKELGQSRNQFVAVLKTENGFKVRIVRGSLSFHKEVTCDCDAPFVDDWMTVQVQQGRLVTGWLNP